jgi:hypothetical protein
MNGQPITLTQFTNTFVPWGVFTAAALLGAETAESLVRSRTIYTSWVVIAFIIASFHFYFAVDQGPETRNYFRLSSTFGWIALLVHLYYGVIVFNGGDLQRVFQNAGKFGAISNFVLAGWWGLDVALAWFAPPSAFVRFERAVLMLLLFATSVVTSIVLGSPFGKLLGVALCAVVLLGVARKIVRRRMAAAAA